MVFLSFFRKAGAHQAALADEGRIQQNRANLVAALGALVLKNAVFAGGGPHLLHWPVQIGTFSLVIVALFFVNGFFLRSFLGFLVRCGLHLVQMFGGVKTAGSGQGSEDNKTEDEQGLFLVHHGVLLGTDEGEKLVERTGNAGLPSNRSRVMAARFRSSSASRWRFFIVSKDWEASRTSL